MTCPTCGGSPIFMGSLANKQWFRCRACGLEWPDDKIEFDPDQEDDDPEEAPAEDPQDEPPFDFDEACNPENGEPDPDPGDDDWSEP